MMMMRRRRRRGGPSWLKTFLRFSSRTVFQVVTAEGGKGSLAIEEFSIKSEAAWRISSPPRPRSLFSRIDRKLSFI